MEIGEMEGMVQDEPIALLASSSVHLISTATGFGMDT